MNDKSVSKESVEKMNENLDFIKFLENGIETGNPEVINNIPFSDLRNACTNSQPSKEENEMNPERLMVFHGSDLNTNISNDQRILNNIQSLTNQEYETFKGQFAFNDKEMSNIGDGITKRINEPTTYQTMNSSQQFDINYEKTQTGQDLLQNSESRSKSPCIDILSTVKNNNTPSGLNMANTDYARIRERRAYSEALEDNSQGINRSDAEFLTKSGQSFATYNKEDSMNYDFSWKKSATNQMAFEHNRLTGIDNVFQTTKETDSLGQGIQVLGDEVKNTLFTFGPTIESNTSVSEIARNDHEPIKISDSMTSNCSRENMLTVPGWYSYKKVNNTNLCADNAFQSIKEFPSFNQGTLVLGDVGKNGLFTVGPTIESNTRISVIAQNDHEPIRISDSMTSNCSRENMLAVPVSTGFHSNENDPNLLGYMLQYLHQEEKGKGLTCKVCKAKIADHKHTYVKNILYECCICNYKDKEPNNLHMHSCTHLSQQFCNVCLNEHTEGDSHDGSKSCIVPMCHKTLHCRTQLTEHLLDHKDYFLRRCWQCWKSFDTHCCIDKGKIISLCCLCGRKTHDKSTWVNHNKTHSPKLFCIVCREEYPAEEKGSHHYEFTCIICNLNFKCKGLFEQHSIDHEKKFYNQCRVCGEELSDHEISDQRNIFKCCFCPKRMKEKRNLRYHLYKHIDLKVYKCDMCGRRFEQFKGLYDHSRPCPAVPYECKRCLARFPRRDFLDLHCSVKHTEV